MNADSYGMAGAIQAIIWTTNTLRLGQGTYWNNVELWDGSAIRLKVASGGNVGIGTTAPTQKLSVQGNTDLGNSYGSTTSSTYTTRVSGHAMRYDASNRYGNYGVLILNADSGWTASARRFMLTSGLDVNKFAIIRSVDATTDPSFGDGGVISSGTADFVINSNGLVGIGITSPTEKLHVNGDTRIVGNTYVGGIINAYQGDASIWVPNLGQAFTVKQTTGNVGIGTTTPSTLLDVNGVITATGGNSTNWNTAFSWGNHASASYVPQARTLTINGTAYDLSANRSWTISTISTIQEAANNGKVTTAASVGTTVITTVATASYDGATFNYVLKDGTNYRAGTIIAVWSAGAVQFNETTTNDIGSTVGVTFAVALNAGNAELRATSATSGWTVKVVTIGI